MSADEVIRVVIADDDALVRSGLRLVLGGSARIEVVAEAKDGTEALDAVRTHAPDVVLMDIRMPVQDGLSATSALASFPDAPAVIVLTTFDAGGAVVKAMQAGASGFLFKDTAPERIVDAIERVMRGEPALSPTAAQSLIDAVASTRPDDRQTSAQILVGTLSTREKAVAISVAKGQTNAQIAQEMYLSVATVKAHVTKVLEKMNADNRVQIAITVHEAGLV
ncbi:MAG: response regulator transcription factor [Terracoccus sp.]